MHPADVVDKALLALSVASIVVVPGMAVLFGVSPGNPADALTLFGAAGTMGGFMVAALALVLASEGSPRVKEIANDNAWRSLLVALVTSMWAWMVTALMSFSFWWTEWSPLWLLTFGLSFAAIISCVRALVFITALVGRFRPLS